METKEKELAEKIILFYCGKVWGGRGDMLIDAKHLIELLTDYHKICLQNAEKGVTRG